MLADVGCSEAEQLIEVHGDIPEARLLQRLVASGAAVGGDRDLRDHCRRVGDLACDLARARGFNDRAMAWFRIGAMLHETGEIALDATELPWDIRPMVRHHRERWDGSGRPEGLEGAEIPLTARILSIADTFDELTTSVQRGACSAEQAIRIMGRESAARFDPELFGLFATRMIYRRRAVHLTA